MAAWKSFAAKYGLRHTSFEQGAYGHVKPKPTTAAHNIDGLDELQGAQAPRTNVESKRQEKTLEERMAESSTWATWALGF